MKNKLEIIQRLLDDGHINAEEAVTLMTKETVFVPQDNYIPYPSPSPFQPVTPLNPYPVTQPYFNTSKEPYSISFMN